MLQELMMGKRAHEEDVEESKESSGKKHAYVAMIGGLAARPDNLIRLYQALEERWRSNVRRSFLFLHQLSIEPPCIWLSNSPAQCLSASLLAVAH